MNTHCYCCNNPLEFAPGHRAHRSDLCNNCQAEIKCCKNCTHYQLDAYNQCRENQAERVLDKERSNFCDYFSLSSRSYGASKDPSQEKDKKKELFDSIFKK